MVAWQHSLTGGRSPLTFRQKPSNGKQISALDFLQHMLVYRWGTLGNSEVGGHGRSMPNAANNSRHGPKSGKVRAGRATTAGGERRFERKAVRGELSMANMSIAGSFWWAVNPVNTCQCIRPWNHQKSRGLCPGKFNKHVKPLSKLHDAWIHNAKSCSWTTSNCEAGWAAKATGGAAAATAEGTRGACSTQIHVGKGWKGTNRPIFIKDSPISTDFCLSL